jgi:hypothetical protein
MHYFQPWFLVTPWSRLASQKIGIKSIFEKVASIDKNITIIIILDSCRSNKDLISISTPNNIKNEYYIVFACPSNDSANASDEKI